jgi:hypothetical protein
LHQRHAAPSRDLAVGKTDFKIALCAHEHSRIVRLMHWF